MTTATLHPPTRPNGGDTQPPNPLPQLLHTPAGLALLELQGTINTSEAAAAAATAALEGEDAAAATLTPVPVGRLDFPEYDPNSRVDSSAWMKRVYLYVGANQRLTGEVKKLPRPLAVIRRRRATATTERREGAEGEEESGEGAAGTAATDDELEVIEIVRYKLVFSQRPEPVGGGGGGVSGVVE